MLVSLVKIRKIGLKSTIKDQTSLPETTVHGDLYITKPFRVSSVLRIERNFSKVASGKG
jgi:hypothetical protein